jgi:hypothetical protein
MGRIEWRPPILRAGAWPAAAGGQRPRESVGHYDGATLVADTIGLNDKTVVDVYRTPHTERLHVVERWRLIDGGKMMQVSFTVEDPSVDLLHDAANCASGQRTKPVWL